jgi:hypothetical protein
MITALIKCMSHYSGSFDSRSVRKQTEMATAWNSADFCLGAVTKVLFRQAHSSLAHPMLPRRLAYQYVRRPEAAPQCSRKAVGAVAQELFECAFVMRGVKPTQAVMIVSC